VAGPILGIDFLVKFRITVALETSQILFACTATALLVTKSFLLKFSQIPEPSFSVSPATEPTFMPPIPDSVPADVKRWLQKFPSILRTGDVMPTLIHGLEHHIHTGSHPPVFAKSRRLDPEKLEIAKAEFKRLESAGTCSPFKITMDLSFAHCAQKKMDPGDPVAIIAVSIRSQPLTSTI
jgi:hypothetical protein